MLEIYCRSRLRFDVFIVLLKYDSLSTAMHETQAAGSAHETRHRPKKKKTEIRNTERMNPGLALNQIHCSGMRFEFWGRNKQRTCRM